LRLRGHLRRNLASGRAIATIVHLNLPPQGESPPSRSIDASVDAKSYDGELSELGALELVDMVEWLRVPRLSQAGDAGMLRV
jgi:hypothetical protein